MELAYKYGHRRLRLAAAPRLLADAMSFFDVFHQLSATRAWPLRAFFRCPGLFDSSFHPAPRATNNDISSSVSFMTAPMSTLCSAYIPPMPTQTPTTISPFMEMPLELICAVIETACEGADDRTRVGLLKSCSLVCRTWSNASQRLLFSKVTLHSQRAFESFMYAVDRSAEHGASLGDAVHHLSDLSLLLDALHSTLEALDLCCCLIAILLGLGSNSKLGELLRRLVAVLTLAGAFDVHSERVLRLLCVLAAMDSLTCTSTVEAVKANI